MSKLLGHPTKRGKVFDEDMSEYDLAESSSDPRQDVRTTAPHNSVVFKPPSRTGSQSSDVSQDDKMEEVAVNFDKLKHTHDDALLVHAFLAGCTFCINLDQRTDRWEEVQPDFAKLGIQVERFSAIKCERGADGCARSFLGCLKIAKERGLHHCLILEDDVFFAEKNPIGKLANAIRHLPEDWDVLALGGYFDALKGDFVAGANYSLKHLRDQNGNQAVCFKYTAYDQMIESYENRQANHPIHFDRFIGINLQKANPEDNRVENPLKGYIMWPTIAAQRPSFSDIKMRHVDYDKECFLQRGQEQKNKALVPHPPEYPFSSPALLEIESAIKQSTSENPEDIYVKLQQELYTIPMSVTLPISS